MVEFFFGAICAKFFLNLPYNLPKNQQKLLKLQKFDKFVAKHNIIIQHIVKVLSFEFKIFCTL